MSPKRIIYPLLIFTILLSGCKKGNHIKQELDVFLGGNVEIPFEKIVNIESLNTSDFVDSVAGKNKMIVYMDSVSCTECFINHMTEYETLRDSLERYGVALLFVIESNKDKKDSIKKQIIEQHLRFACFLDTVGIFCRENNIPTDPLLHTFLLNKKNEVVMAGDPMRNKLIENLLFKYLRNLISKNYRQ